MHVEDSSSEKIRDFLKSKAPFSVIDLGINLSEDDSIVECSKTGDTIQGIVSQQELSNEESNSEELNDNSSEASTEFSLSLRIISGLQIRAKCSCSSVEEMEEQWCPHAVALLWHAHSLGFLSESSGFSDVESIYRINTNSPKEIAKIVKDASSDPAPTSKIKPYIPNVEVGLELKSDRLGVQLSFDGETQTPSLFEIHSKRSSRALDNLLIQIVDEEGSWDEIQNLWYVNSSRGIEIILGLLGEYKKVFSLDNKENISLENQLMNAQVSVEWQDTSVELILNWLLPNGKTLIKKEELIGTGPYWVFIKDKIHKLSPSASRLASIFPYSSTISLTRSQMGPILEVINSGNFEDSIINVVNPKKQPSTEIVDPKCKVNLELEDSSVGHFGSGGEVHVFADVEFEYPLAPPEKNLVYLRNIELEENTIKSLEEIGFEYKGEYKKLTVSNDKALDLIYESKNHFNKDWEVDGLSKIKKQIKFNELALDINLASSKEKELGSNIDWFECNVALTQNSAKLPLSFLFKREQKGYNKWVKLDSGAFAKVPGGGLKQLKTSLGMLDPNFKLSNSIKTKLTTAQSIGIAGIKDEKIRIKTDKKVKAISKKLLDFENITRLEEGKNFGGTLRPYQRDGLSWLHFLFEYNLDGILADEMGLGKTVQTLALIQHLKFHKSKAKAIKNPVLIVAPTSVITNWLYEARRFTPKLKVLLLHGPKRKNSFKDIQDHDIIITSYALLRLDRYELEKNKFSYAILDEAQNIKNPQAATTKSAKALDCDHRLALTGTPTENRPMELWSILDFLMPGYLGSYEFFKKFIEKPILEEGTNINAVKFLNSKTRPFILRRLKADVEKDLPPKVESVMHVPMHESQANMYAQILEEVRPSVMDAISEKGVRGASISILAALLRLRQVCNHPNSIAAFQDLEGYESGKFDLLKELVTEAISSGKKLLVFSQFRGMLSIIKEWLAAESINHLYLDGSTKNRQDLVDQFNSDEDVRLFLISLKAGGTGLNLTAADTVIIYDPWWNPAVESQAVDRAHRIGQKNKVAVYRLVTENSVEQKIMGLKKKKSDIFDALINETGLSTLNLTKEDIESFFTPISLDVE